MNAIRFLWRKNKQMFVQSRKTLILKSCKETRPGRRSVPAGVNDHDEFVPLGAVSDCQLDLAQGEVTRA